jgi:hypothetical protein
MATDCVPEAGPFRAGIGPVRFGMEPPQTVWMGPLGSVTTRTAKVRNTRVIYQIIKFLHLFNMSSRQMGFRIL